MKGTLHMRTFFAMNHTDLQYTFWALTAVAVIFGNKWFGGILARIPGLTRPGGFYSRLIIVTVLVCFLTAVDYACDRITNHIILHVIQQALHLPVTEAQYAVGVALPVAVLYFTYPNLGRIGNRDPVNTSAEVPGIMKFLGQLILFAGYYGGGVLSVFLARQYLFNILHWFVGRAYPSNTILLIAALAVPLSYAGGTLLQDVGKRLQSDGSTALGCVTLVGAVLVIPLVLFCFALTLADLGFSVYLARQIGWATAVIFAVVFAGSIFINLLSLWADNLKSKQLEGLYTFIPAGLAAVIQVGLLYPGLLPG
jgi:hypothetical protein